MLDPYKLNKSTTGYDALMYPEYDFIKRVDVKHRKGYENYILKPGDTFAAFPYSVVAVAADSSIPRVRSQAGVFTLHRDERQLLAPSSKLSSHVRKLGIPRSMKAEVRHYLAMSGTTAFTVYPDLHGLAMMLRRAVVPVDMPELL